MSKRIGTVDTVRLDNPDGGEELWIEIKGVGHIGVVAREGESNLTLVVPVQGKNIVITNEGRMGYLHHIGKSDEL